MTAIALTTQEPWLEREFDDIKVWVIGEVDKLKPLVDIADKLVNEIKTLEASAAGQFVETTIETLIPASTGLINAFRLQLPVWVIDLNWAADEEGKTDDQKWQDAVTYLNGIVDPDVRAAQLNTLKALFSKFFAGNSGHALTMPQSLTISQPSHDPAIATAA